MNWELSNIQTTLNHLKPKRESEDFIYLLAEEAEQEEAEQEEEEESGIK